jgi:cytochrome d ubiquinol oxidase subunit II
MLAGHGATYLTLKTDGPVHDRSAAYAKGLWLAVIPLLVVISLETWFVRPDVIGHAISNPLAWLGVAVVLFSAIALFSGIRHRHEMRAYLGSNGLIVGMLATGGAAIYPIMLSSTIAPEYSLSADQVAANPGALLIGAVWWPVALALTVGYWIFVSRHYAGKVSASSDIQGSH